MQPIKQDERNHSQLGEVEYILIYFKKGTPSTSIPYKRTPSTSNRVYIRLKSENISITLAETEQLDTYNLHNETCEQCGEKEMKCKLLKGKRKTRRGMYETREFYICTDCLELFRELRDNVFDDLSTSEILANTL